MPHTPTPHTPTPHTPTPHTPDYLILTEATVADYRPMLAKMWHPTLNGRVTPDRVKIGSELAVFWQCLRCNKVWPESVRSRVTADGIGHNGCTDPLPESIFVDRTESNECRQRSGRRPQFVVDVYPELSKRWNTELNGETKFSDLKLSRKGRLWWTCPTCVQPWNATIATMRLGSAHRCRSADLAKVAAVLASDDVDA